MSSTDTCLSCGATGPDVGMRFIEVPEASRRRTPVLLPVSHREGAIEVPIESSEQYIAEPRCEACRVQERLLAGKSAMSPSAPPAGHDLVRTPEPAREAPPAEEGPSWMR